MPTWKGTEVSLSYVQCFLCLVSSIYVSIFHFTWLDTSWTELIYLICLYICPSPHPSRPLFPHPPVHQCIHLYQSSYLSVCMVYVFTLIMEHVLLCIGSYPFQVPRFHFGSALCGVNYEGFQRMGFNLRRTPRHPGRGWKLKPVTLCVPVGDTPQECARECSLCSSRQRGAG